MSEYSEHFVKRTIHDLLTSERAAQDWYASPTPAHVAFKLNQADAQGMASVADALWRPAYAVLLHAASVTLGSLSALDGSLVAMFSEQEHATKCPGHAMYAAGALVWWRGQVRVSWSLLT